VEAEEVLLLKKQYPYSQVLRVLAAKVSKDHGFSNQQQELQSAAVYTADRAVLKAVVNTEYNPDRPADEVKVQPDLVKEKSAKILNPLPSKEIIPGKQATWSIDSGDVADTVMFDLQRLNKSRHDFESMFDGLSDHPVEIIRSKADEAVLHIHQQVEALASRQEKSGKTKKERIVELARALEAERMSEGTDPVSDKKTGDTLIDEIVNTKTVITPETEKQKKQIEIIDQFIKAQPMIANSKDKPLPIASGDFSTIKSGEFGDNIVSETLVDILIKQGKKDKAVEVLKKLIWKYPQKKAYFAAQIDELKK